MLRKSDENLSCILKALVSMCIKTNSLVLFNPTSSVPDLYHTCTNRSSPFLSVDYGAITVDNNGHISL